VACDPGAGPDLRPADELSLTDWFESRLLALRGLSPDEQRGIVLAWWRALAYRECFLVTKLLTGALRVGVSRGLVVRAIAEARSQPRADVEAAMMGEWSPSADWWRALGTGARGAAPSRPYPFCLAAPLESPPESLGDRERWLAEWKWDGIRGQLIRRRGAVFLWSRGEELITDRFPEITQAAATLPDGTVLDGEVLAWDEAGVLPFARLQQRIGRRKLTPTVLRAAPARFLAYDLLERDGEDLRERPLRERRAALEALLASAPAALGVSPRLDAPSWDALSSERESSRTRRVEGLILKSRDSGYRAGRERGVWWKWKIDARTFDAVMLYAHPGHGRRSNLYTDYTFAVWKDEALVPVAKAYSGLTDAEIQRLDRWIRAHTLEKFGPTRRVEPVQVFEIAYEGIARSTRHKSGIALRFPRIHRWRDDKPAAQADTLAALERVLAQEAVDG
jgi:DNA ligase-1